MDTNNELLQAICQIMDSKLAAALEPISARLEGLEQGQKSMQTDIADLKAGQAVIQEDVDQIKNVATKIDHEVIPRINSLYDGHKLNSEKLDGIQKSLDEVTPTVLALDVIHHADWPIKAK